MATFTGQRIKDTYESVLKLKDNENLTSSDKVVTDGLGNETPLSISTNSIESSVNIEATGFKTPTGTSTEYLRADGTVANILQDKEYVFDQTIPSASWSINHQLNKRPSCVVVDTAGTVVVGAIQHIDNNNIKITFNSAFSGEAYIN